MCESMETNQVPSKIVSAIILSLLINSDANEVFRGCQLPANYFEMM